MLTLGTPDGILKQTPDEVRSACEVLWDPPKSERLALMTGFPAIRIGFHGRHQCWALGVMQRVAIDVGVHVEAITECRDMIALWHLWMDEDGNAKPYDEARIARAVLLGLQQSALNANRDRVADIKAARLKDKAKVRDHFRDIAADFKGVIQRRIDDQFGYVGMSDDAPEKKYIRYRGH